MSSLINNLKKKKLSKRIHPQIGVLNVARKLRNYTLLKSESLKWILKNFSTTLRP